MALKISNNISSSLASGVSAGATSIPLVTGGASGLPTLGANDYTIASIISASNPAIEEIIHVTAISGDTLTVVRGEEGTTALNWNANDLFQCRPTGGAITSRQPNVLTYAGNPNGHVAGDTSPTQDMVWDTTDSILWICTTAGTASTAVWETVGLNAIPETGFVASTQTYIATGTPATILNGAAAGSWTTLASGAPAGAKIAWIRVLIASGGTAPLIVYGRQTGSGVLDSVYSEILRTETAVNGTATVPVPLNSSQQFDYMVNIGAIGNNIQIYLLGYGS